MKRFSFLLLLSIAVLVSMTFSPVQSQDKKIRPSLKASITQRLGVETDITIDYSRPGVKGRKIWGELVPYGLGPGGKSNPEKRVPWRAGANETTTLTFSKDILIEGQKLPAGKYGLFMIPSEKEWVIIFSKKNAEWGSYTYDEADDAMRVTVTPVKAPHQEWLLYGFDELAGTKATMYLHWEELKIPVHIETTE